MRKEVIQTDIQAQNIEKFQEIKDFIDKLSKEFIKDFQLAQMNKYVSKTIILKTDYFTKKSITLPNNFVISEIKISASINYEKSNEDYKEIKRYSITVVGKYMEYNLELIYNNMYDKDVMINVDRW